MRTSLLIGVVALLSGQAQPALAQFGAPFGSPGLLTTPELSSGALGAGAANSATTPQQCGNTGGGRDGVRYQCTPTNEQQKNRR